PDQVQQQRPPQRVVAQQRLQAALERREVQVLGDHHGALVRLQRRPQRFQLGERREHRFLDEQVLAGRQRQLDQLPVRARRDTDHDRIAGRRDRLFVAAEMRRGAHARGERLGPPRVAAGDGDARAGPQPPQRADVPGADAAAPEEADRQVRRCHREAIVPHVSNAGDLDSGLLPTRERMPRTKVFYFIPNLQQGGPEGQILELINRLPQRFEAVLCVYHGDNVFWGGRLPPGQPAHDLGVRSMNLAALDRLTDILRREKPAIVHSYRDKANFWARWAASRAGVPITITGCRNRMMGLRYLATEWFLQRKSKVILANSIGVKHELVRWARVRDDKVRVIYNLLDVEQFRPPTDAERAEARARWQLDDDTLALLLPGRIGLQKHQLGLLAAMRAVARRGRWPGKAVVLFAGRARDRLTSALVRRFAGRPDLAPAVRFLDAVKDI